MRLSRPVAIGLLALIALLLLWLMLNQGGGSDDTAAESPTAVATVDPAPSGEPSPSPTPTPEPGAAGPSGVDTRDWDDIDACRDGDLPRELEPVTDDIAAGGPFEHPGKDGSTFGNRERLLPDESRGYYREYTVETPGSRDRGARRIVTGGGETDPEVWYYTDDHYDSFCEFTP